MPRDYAKHVNRPKRPLAKPGWRKRLLLAVFLFSLLGGLTYGAYLYQHNQATLTQQSIGMWVKQVKALFIRSRHEEDPYKSMADQTQTDEEPEIQFSFYTSLPTMQTPMPQEAPKEIIVEKRSNPVLVKKSVPAVNVSQPVIQPNVTEKKYLLQIAAFRNPTAAGEMRISLLLAGFEVEIVKAMNNNQQIYQLQQGPFATIAEVKAIQRELEKKGIESVIVKKIQ